MERARELLNDFRRELDQSKPLHAGSRLAEQWRSEQTIYGMLARKAGIDVPIDPELLHPGPPVDERYPVAHFETKDFSGKTWSLADLRGKVTYIIVWKIGCGSCQAALQGVQQLFERWKNRGDRAVLAISVDESPAIAESFMKENEYSFPTIYGTEIAAKFVPGGGWPTAWLIDPQGRRFRRRLPPPSDQTISKIEELADKVAVIQ
jgi:thiol-disulfide isomerase/thioredoxin